jgi:four helix bundle protein
LKRRTKKFALDVIKVCHHLPQTFEIRHAISQVIRSSSSVAANYRSACRGKSKADFISKLGTVEEEADESGFWLEMLREISRLGIAKFPPQVYWNWLGWRMRPTNSSQSWSHRRKRLRNRTGCRGLCQNCRRGLKPPMPP